MPEAECVRRGRHEPANGDDCCLSLLFLRLLLLLVLRLPLAVIGMSALVIAASCVENDDHHRF